jgi:hypothetical protein
MDWRERALRTVLADSKVATACEKQAIGAPLSHQLRKLSLLTAMVVLTALTE